MKEVIGIIDRGVGGLGLYKKLRQTSQRPIVYFADNGSIPYGLIEKSTLKKRLENIISVLKEHQVSKIAFACNSASVVYPDSYDIKGIISFGVSSLARVDAKDPALIATQGTVNSGVYRSAFKQKNMSVIERKAQQLAILIERGIISGDEIDDAAAEILLPLKDCDALLMACTHFPAISDLLERHIDSDCQLIDPVNEMAEWIETNWLNQQYDLKRIDLFLLTGSSRQFISSAKLSFNVEVDPDNIINIDPHILDEI